MLRKIVSAIVMVVGVLALIQVLPFGHNHTNPPIGKAVSWPDQQSHELAVRACYDCHSNQTEWPWYSNVAPLSWLIQKDVDEGRSKLNFSEMDKPYREANKASDLVRKGDMPQWYYVMLHPSANLSADEKPRLMQALDQVVGKR